MEVEMWPVGRLKPYPGNPRVNDAGVDAVAAADERWEHVPGYEGLYEVSSHGRVRRSSPSRKAPAGHVLKPKFTWDGYPSYGLSRRRRAWHVKAHRLVALAFLGPPPFPGAHVAHFDGNKTNNRVGNLRWATPAENEADKRRHGRVKGARPGEAHHQAKLTTAMVAEMRRRVAAGATLTSVARQFDAAVLTTHNAVRGLTWRVVTDPPPVPVRERRPA